MKFILLITCLLTLNISYGQIEVFEKFKTLEERYLSPNNNDTTYIVNFWATWCVPCIKELPYFEELNQKYSNDKVKIILVSLDMENRINSLVIPFIKKKNINSKVVLLTDGKTNSWIDRVDPNWSGAIPATIFIKGKKKKFYEKKYHNTKELETDLLKLTK